MNFSYKKTLIYAFMTIGLMGLIGIKNTKATTSALTGQYGCLFNKNFGAQAANHNAISVGDLINALSYVNFDSGTGNGTTVLYATPKVTSEAGSFTFTVAAGPVTNSYLMTLNATSGASNGTFTYVLLPVNGGNTLLLQQGASGTWDGDALTGICNKV